MSIELEVLRQALVDRYRIERELGAGGMAVVFLADDLRHGRKVAIKVLRSELAAMVGPDRFLSEIRTIARLTHPHILPLHDSGEAEGHLYYVMPYVEGESLGDRLAREGQLPVDEAVRIGIEVADALDYAHSRGIVHRDIKPGNILLSRRHALVADFGIARAIGQAGAERLTRTGIAVGSPVYMSPEQASGDSVLDGRSDVYSLGCVLYEMLTGGPPFGGPTYRAILSRHMTDEAPPLRHTRREVPALLDEAVRIALRKDPEDRYTSAAALRERLEGTYVESRRRGPLSRWIPQTVRRVLERARVDGRLLRWSLPTLLGVVLVALGIGWAMSGTEDFAESREPALIGLGPAEDSRPSIAVLPFDDTSPGGGRDYISDGVTEEIANALTAIRELKVIGRTSAFAYKGASRDLREIGAELDVDYLVEGSVLQTPDSLQITVQLINAQDGSRVWSSRYAREPGDVFVMHSEVAVAIAAALRVPLRTEMERLVTPTENLEAYDAYALGKAYMRERGTALLDAIQFFERAVALDSSWASAWAALAEALELRIWYPSTYDDIDAVSDSAEAAAVLAAAEAAALRALAIDSSNASALIALGSIHRNRTEWEQAESAYRRALSAAPDNPEAHGQYAQFLLTVGRIAEGVRYADRAAALDPTQQRIATLGSALELDGRLLESSDVARWNLVRHPDGFGSSIFVWGHLDPFLKQGATTEALQFADRGLAGLEIVWTEEQRDAFITAIARRNFSDLPDRLRRSLDPDHWMMMGEPDSAIVYLVRAGRHRIGVPFNSYLWLPELDAVRSDARVREHMVYLNLDGATVERTDPLERTRPLILQRSQR